MAKTIQELENEINELKKQNEDLKEKNKVKYTEAHRKAMNRYREKNRLDYNLKQRLYYQKKSLKAKMDNMTPEQLIEYNEKNEKYKKMIDDMNMELKAIEDMDIELVN